MTSYANVIYPVPRRFVGFGKEPAGSSGTLTAPTSTLPLTNSAPLTR